jgi:DNA-binding LytR/AlgR family response regulator
LADFVLIRQKGKFVRFDIEDLHSLECDKDYVKLRWGVNKIILHMPMTRFLKLLPGRSLLRINKSLAVKKSEIADFDKGFVRMKDGNRIPAGTIYRDSITEYLNSRDAHLDVH